MNAFSLIGLLLVIIGANIYLSAFITNPILLAVLGVLIFWFLDDILERMPSGYLVEINNILIGLASLFTITYLSTFIPTDKPLMLIVIGLIGILIGGTQK